MKNKIFRYLFFTSALTALLISVLISYVMYHGYTQNMQLNVRQTAIDYQRILDESETENAELLQNIPSASFRITLISPNGEVLFDNRSDTTEDHSDRPEIIAALSSGVGSATRYSDTIQHQTYYYAVEIDSGNVLRISLTSDTVFRTFIESIPLVFLCFLFVVAICFLLVKRITEKFVQPINSINIESPTENNTYIELSPLLLRIENQNNQLKSQTTEMQNMRDELSGIMEHMEEGLIVLNKHGAIISINRAALTLLGKRPDDCIGKFLLEVHRGEFFEQLNEIVENAVNTALEFEEGNKIYHVSISNIKSGGSIIMFVDSTQQRFAERMRREFSANVSHELKTPLQTISGYAELLKNNMVQDGDKPRFIEKIYDESIRMSLLIQDIIKLSQLDEAAKGITKEKTNITEVAKAVIEQLSQKAEKKQVQIVFSQQNPIFIKAIPTVIKECIFNLIDNAIEYNKKDGTVSLDILVEKDNILLIIKDTGIGIPADEQTRVFERFYRVEKSRCRSNGGTGLGLSIVKHAVAVHAGEITLTSNENEGTSIIVKLPT